MLPLWFPAIMSISLYTELSLAVTIVLTNVISGRSWLFLYRLTIMVNYVHKFLVVSLFCGIGSSRNSFQSYKRSHVHQANLKSLSEEHSSHVMLGLEGGSLGGLACLFHK